MTSAALCFSLWKLQESLAYHSPQFRLILELMARLQRTLNLPGCQSPFDLLLLFWKLTDDMLRSLRGLGRLSFLYLDLPDILVSRDWPSLLCQTPVSLLVDF